MKSALHPQGFGANPGLEFVNAFSVRQFGNASSTEEIYPQIISEYL